MNKNIAEELKQGLKNENLLLVDFQPTCENLLIHFTTKLNKRMPAGITLHHLLLRETDTSYAEWYADDNK
ncbi:MAG TPA: 6-carboxytetrahydropterin synthase [Bacteroidia bacterium]|nr:6-carboxytetrahydropterin synthase [Bacteroidia bacterium]